MAVTLNQLPHEGGILDQGRIEVEAIMAYLEAKAEREAAELKKAEKKGGR